MYSDKKNIRELVTLMLGHGIDHIVLSPGSRNAPLLHTFSQHPDFTCFTVVDERSAGFFALGLAQNLQRPVALCCTSGSALLNYAPAVSEAYYQKIPLLVISADRPIQWLGQQDGQMIPQQKALTGICNVSVQLPEIQTKEEAWYCNRLINEAILALDKNGKGPSHINIPVSEPLYKFTAEPLPLPRLIRKRNARMNWDACTEAETLCTTPKCWILVGQLPPDNQLSDLLSRVARKYDALIVCEHTANISSAEAIRNMDALLYTLSEEEQADLAPDLLISFGGHLVSKRVKQYLRKQVVTAHWWISDTDEVIDSFGLLTDILSVDPATFFEALLLENGKENTNYSQKWMSRSDRLSDKGEAWAKKAEYSDLTVVGDFLDCLPEGVALHLGNSSSIRNAQLFPLPPDTKVYSNRGVSGIDGVVSTAVGFAALNNQTTFLISGDLSFFYDMNALWNRHLNSKLRIMMINNGSGGIFHLLPGADQSAALNDYIACHHHTEAKVWAESRGFHYLSAHNRTELHEQLDRFTDTTTDKPMFLEVFTSHEVNPVVFKAYFHHLKSTEEYGN